MTFPKSKDNLNIYLVHSPRQAYFVKKTIKKFTPENNIIITDDNYFSKDIKSEIISEPTFKFGYSYYTEWTYFLKRLSERKKSFKYTNLFVSDIYWKINNALISGLRWDKIFLIDDGTLNIQNQDFKYITTLKYLFLEICHNFKIYPKIKSYRGKINGLDKFSYEAILTDNEKILQSYSIKKILFTNSRVNVEDNSRALVVGQNLDMVYNYSYYRIILDEIFKKLTNNGFNIFYKPHPREGKSIRTEIKSISHINYIDTKISVEAYFQKLKPKVVVSMYSTGLINIAKSSNAKCFYYKINDYSSKKEIYDYMNEIGIIDFEVFGNKVL